MNTSRSFYIGIDVSKSWFDASLIAVVNFQKQTMQTQRFDNTKAGLKVFHKWLKKAKVTFNNHLLVVLENTGIYHRLLWQYCTTHNLPIHIGNAAHIKWSLGITRGKTDPIDSKRLCTYAFKESEDLRRMPALQACMLELKDLISARKKLIKQRASIRQHLGELKIANSKSTQAFIEKAHKAALDGMDKSVGLLEERIQIIIEENPNLTKNYQLLISIPGIGRWTAVYLLGCTNNFNAGYSGKQLACYAGVAPFEHKSGSSVKGRSRLHKMANKDLKALLHMGVLSCVKNYPEFRNYYQRKVDEGKHKLAVMNAIKNKLLLRVAAVIKNQKPYEERSTYEPQDFRKNYLLKS